MNRADTPLHYDEEQAPQTPALVEIQHCTKSQIRFWIEEQLHPRNSALNLASCWRLQGYIAHSHLEGAWRRLLNRHDALRTSFIEVDGEPRQMVAPSVTFSVALIDLRALPEAQRTAEAERLAEVEARTAFDLSHAPLIRVTRLLLTEEVNLLLVTTHQIVCDRASIAILADEMGQICSALHADAAPFLPESPGNGRYAARDQQTIAARTFDIETAAARKLFSGYKPFEILPDYPRPRVQTSNGEIVSILLEPKLTDAFEEFAQRKSVTLFVSTLAALFTILHRYTGEVDIAISTQVGGRDEVELERTVGCFINTIGLRGDLSDNPTFDTLLSRTQDMVGKAFDIRHLPFERLIEIVNPQRDLSRNALFCVNFVFERSFVKNHHSYGSFTLVDLPSHSAGSQYDLNFSMIERAEGWRLACEFNTDLFAHATIAPLLDRLHKVMNTVLQDPDIPISRIPLLSELERRALIFDANQTQADYPADKTLPQLISRQAARTPDSTAIVCGEAVLSYAALEEASNRLTRELARRGIARGTRVGILLDRSPNLVVALLATLKLGCAYVPLDPTYPRDRLAFIVQNAEIVALITQQAHDVPSFGTGIVRIDIDTVAIEEESGSHETAGASVDDVAYTIYTSGSTGTPKGVDISHRALVNLLWAMRERPGIHAGDTLVAVTTICFDIAALELFLPLIVGAKLVIAPENVVVSGVALWQLLQRTNATVMQATPVTWQLLIDAGWRGGGPHKMLCGGEALSRPLAEQLLQRGEELWNLYGPTETTVWSSASRVEAGRGAVPIGPPIANTQFYVLDPQGELSAPGVPGELFIGGDGVALGYRDRPELTSERFVADTFNPGHSGKLYRTGDIVRRRGAHFEFLGRSDHQVKIRGFRIELDEISAALLAAPNVAEAAAIVAEDSCGGPSIRAYVASYTATSPKPNWAAALRATIARSLPAYMLPTAIIIVDHLPRTPNGKIDRHALLQIGDTRVATLREPVTTFEKKLIGLLEELLGHARFGLDDDLFGWGLHSVLAVRLVARIVDIFDVRLSLRVLFDTPSVSAIARCIESASLMPRITERFEPIVALNPDGREHPLFFLHSDAFAEGGYCRRLATTMGRSLPFYAVAPHGTLGLPVMSSIESMAADYYERVKQVQSSGPYRIAGFCDGGLVAFELARQLRARGDTVEHVIIINRYAPPRSRLAACDALVRRVGLDARLDAQMREKISSNIARLSLAADGGLAAFLRYLGTRVRTLWGISRRTQEHAKKYPAPDGWSSGTPEAERYLAQLVASLTYHPKQFDGDLTLIWSADEELEMGDPMRGDVTMGWGAVCAGVRVMPMQGGHHSPIGEHVDDLAKVLKELLCR